MPGLVRVLRVGGMGMDWIKLKASVGLTGAVIGGIVGVALGGWDMWLQALVLFVVLDYASGLLAAFVERKLHSEVGFKGVAKKVSIFILVAVAYQIDILMGTELTRLAVIGFYLGTEGLSILKNAGRAGLPIPDVLAKALEELREGKGGKYEG